MDNICAFVAVIVDWQSCTRSVSQCTWFGMACAEKSFDHFFGEKQKRDFENEVGVMVRLNHPHVVRLICCHQDSCRNPSFGLATNAKGLQGCGPRGSPGVTSETPGSVGECRNPCIWLTTKVRGL
ncbi:unnamed protein product [Sphagnum jensenii]|uniref:Serine-threonine/tyrosine-protein kinase catalytic domain-containing protein n=1 Tax=Sphagnum jensenii TaxID=128206 RepID=A0ABP1B016_9BRYO